MYSFFMLCSIHPHELHQSHPSENNITCIVLISHIVKYGIEKGDRLASIGAVQVHKKERLKK